MTKKNSIERELFLAYDESLVTDARDGHAIETPKSRRLRIAMEAYSEARSLGQ